MRTLHWVFDQVQPLHAGYLTQQEESQRSVGTLLVLPS